ncbi:MAG: thiamine-phosphate kinase [Bacteroidales bacterium]|nr:thiamine-phosphate kinase [Bacteroidales bacterium]
MTEDKPKRTELSELGEFGLIDRLTRGIRHRNPGTVVGVGDDAAVLSYPDKKILISKDLLIEGVHFDLVYTPLKHLGYKAAVVNFSDVAAMFGFPRQLMVGIGISNRFSAEAIDELYSGIKLACERYDVDLIGGDTVSSISGLILSLTVVGDAHADQPVFRNTAREGDLVCVSGDLGAAYTGLLILEREKQVYRADPLMQPDLAGYDYILERQLKPEARTDIVRLLSGAGVRPTAMIDISDGLASEIIHICNDSGLGCKLYEEKIPVDATTSSVADEFGISPVTCAMNGGEDYELLFTVRQEDYDKIKDMPVISIIGHMTERNEGISLVSRNGSLIGIQAQGWDAFIGNKKIPR